MAALNWCAFNRSVHLRYLTRPIWAGTVAAGLLATIPALANTAAPATTEIDALDLKSAPEVVAASSDHPTRVFFEGALGHIGQRYRADQNLHRGSIDLVHTARLGSGWRVVFSDRVDVISPVDSGSSRTTTAIATWSLP